MAHVSASSSPCALVCGLILPQGPLPFTRTSPIRLPLPSLRSLARSHRRMCECAEVRCQRLDFDFHTRRPRGLRCTRARVPPSLSPSLSRARSSATCIRAHTPSCAVTTQQKQQPPARGVGCHARGSAPSLSDPSTTSASFLSLRLLPHSSSTRGLRSFLPALLERIAFSKLVSPSHPSSSTRPTTPL